MKRALEVVAADGFEIVPSIWASAQPSAPAQHSVFEKYLRMIIEDLRSASRVDAVLLHLHGAMVTKDCYDCEGEVLKRVREEVGPQVPIGVVLDPHAHLTSTMVSNASVMAFMKEYPHTDGLERTNDVLKILFDMLEGRICPTPAVYDCRLVGLFPTQTRPMRDFVDRMIKREGKDGVLSISFIHGFPWGDTPDTGAKILVYTNSAPSRAQQIAEELHQEIWEMKDSASPTFVSVKSALRTVATADRGLVVIADMADNPGGGAPSDATYLLRAVLDAGETGIGFGLFFDPEAVRTCFAAGVGAAIDLRIGGKIGRTSGLPVDLQVQVKGLRRNAMMDVMGLAIFPMGDTAWVHGAGVDIVLNTIRVQLYSPSALRAVGLEPESLKVLAPVES